VLALLDAGPNLSLGATDGVRLGAPKCVPTALETGPNLSAKPMVLALLDVGPNLSLGATDARDSLLAKGCLTGTSGSSTTPPPPPRAPSALAPAREA